MAITRKKIESEDVEFTGSVDISSGAIAGITDLAIADGGTGASTAQAAIDALTQVSGATNEHVLTKDTSTGNATWKAAAGGGAPVDAQYVALATNGTLTNERVLTAGEGIDLTDNGAGSTIVILCEDASDTNKGISELATTAEINIGNDTGRTITPDAFAGSNLGTKSVCIAPFASDEEVIVGDGTVGFCVPDSMNGMNLVNVRASIYELATGLPSGTIDVQVRRRRPVAGSDVNMLTTAVTLATTEYTVSDETIDTSNDDIVSGDMIYVDVDATITGSTPVYGLSVSLEFRLP